MPIGRVGFGDGGSRALVGQPEGACVAVRLEELKASKSSRSKNLNRFEQMNANDMSAT